MLKLKYRVLEKLNNLTRSEMKLALYIAKLSEEQSGCVEGLYYRDAMTACGFCKQSYYNALRGLMNKGAITCEKKTDVDSDVLLLDNGFPWKGTAAQTYSDGYISMASSVFQSPEFEELKANEKYLLLEFMRRTFGRDHSYRSRVERFTEEWTGRLKVSGRTLRGYLHRLKNFFSIKIKDGMYHISRRHALFAKNPTVLSEAKVQSQQAVRCACNRLHLTYTPDNLKDTAGLIGQYKKIAGSIKDAAAAVVQCMEDTVSGIRYKDRRLDSRFVHRLLADLFEGKGKKDRGDPDEYPDMLKSEEPKKPQGTGRRNSFHNFNERDYDYNKLEKWLLSTSPS